MYILYIMYYYIHVIYIYISHWIDISIKWITNVNAVGNQHLSFIYFYLLRKLTNDLQKGRTELSEFRRTKMLYNVFWIQLCTLSTIYFTCI